MIRGTPLASVNSGWDVDTFPTLHSSDNTTPHYHVPLPGTAANVPQSDGSVWLSVSLSTAGIAPSNANYVTTQTEGGLTAEHVITGTANQIVVTVAAGLVTLSTPITAASAVTITGGGTIALAGYTLTVPATGTVALATGIAGGQTIYGGTAANDDITIEGTSHATKTTSAIILQPSGGVVSIGTTATDSPLTFAASAPAVSSTPNKIQLYAGLCYGFGVSTSTLNIQSTSNIVFYQNSTAKVIITGTSNSFGLGVMAFGTNALKVLGIGNGIAPTTSITGAQIWSTTNGLNVMGSDVTGVTTIAASATSATLTLSTSLTNNGAAGIITWSGAYTLTVPATGTAALLATANAFTALNTFSATIVSGSGQADFEVVKDLATTNSYVSFTHYRNGSTGAAVFVGRTAYGSRASPTATLSGQVLATFAGRGFGDTVFSTTNKGAMQFLSAELFTDTAQGTFILWQTTPIGSVTIASKMILSSAGNLGLGITSNSGFGTNAAGVYASASGTAPTTAPADMSQWWTQDINGAAGYAGLHKRTETTNVSEVVPGVVIKTDTGRTANPYEGFVEINFFDNLVAIYADAGWRTLASGW